MFFTLDIDRWRYQDVTPMTPTPSFVVIVTDEMPAFAAHYRGHDTVSTPNLDRLAARSTDYRRCFVANPICMPNRASMLTGLLPSAHGTRVNGIPLRRDAETFTERLRLAGYHTAAVGKLHHQPYGGPLRPHVESLVAGDHASADWELRDRFADDDIALPNPYYGFEHTDLVIGAGDTATGNYRHWLLSHGVNPDTTTGYAKGSERLDSWEQVYRTSLPVEYSTTTYITQRSIEHLHRFAADEQPFALWVSFPDPHHPFCPPSPWFDLYAPTDIGLDPTFWASHEDPPPHIAAMWAERGHQRRPFDCWAPTESQTRAALAAAYGMISQVDDAVGQLLDALDRVGRRDDTIVVFTSDHGDMFGQHGLLLKHLVHYDACVRVPFLVDVPGRDGGINDDLVSSLDLAPSVLATAGLTGLPGCHGVDLGWATDPRQIEREAVLIEEDEMFGGSPTGDGEIAIRTLRTDRYRYTRYQPGGEELYDLRADPCELVNRAADPALRSVKQDLIGALLDETTRQRDRSTPPRYSA